MYDLQIFISVFRCFLFSMYNMCVYETKYMSILSVSNIYLLFCLLTLNSETAILSKNGTYLPEKAQHWKLLILWNPVRRDVVYSMATSTYNTKQNKSIAAPSNEDSSNYEVTEEMKKPSILNRSIEVLAPISTYRYIHIIPTSTFG